MKNTQRYIAKFVNGTWAVFDTHQYRNVATRALKKQTETEASKRNAVA